MKLVLFDIDGTLLWTDGAGRRAMEGAMLEVFGIVGDTSYRYDGKTDRQIAREQMRGCGFDDAYIGERFEHLMDRYVERLELELDRDDSARQCLGVSPLLDAVEAHEHAVLGLLTGNIKRGAQRKLRKVGIDFDRFKVNAFGCDHEDRPELPAIAQRRALEDAGVHIPGDQLVIIGDTPADIECGRSLGVRAIGVATGRYSVDDLMAHDPSAVFETLEDTDAVLEAIFD